jgi:hypothetical protein
MDAAAARSRSSSMSISPYVAPTFACRDKCIISRRTSNTPHTFFDTWNSWLLSVGRNGCITCRRVLRSPRETILVCFHADHSFWVTVFFTYGAVVRSSFLLRIGSDMVRYWSRWRKRFAEENGRKNAESVFLYLELFPVKPGLNYVGYNNTVALSIKQTNAFEIQNFTLISFR